MLSYRQHSSAMVQHINRKKRRRHESSVHLNIRDDFEQIYVAIMMHVFCSLEYLYEASEIECRIVTTAALSQAK